MGSSVPPKEDWIAHTLRLPPDLNAKMLFAAHRRYGGNVQLFLMALVKTAVELPEPPDCNTCGFRIMGEAIIDKLRGR